MFLSKEIAADKRTVKRHLETLDCDVFVKSIGGATRKLVLAATSGSGDATVDLPADQFAQVSARMCAEAILGENKQPIADYEWWYDQPTDVLIECRKHVADVSGLRGESIEREKKESDATQKNDSPTASPAVSASTPTNCEPVLAAAN